MANNGELKSGEALIPTEPHRKAINQGLVSPNGEFQMQYQNDGNLVLYQTLKDGERSVVESADTNRIITLADSYAMVANQDSFPNGDYSGKLVILVDGKPVWSTITKGPKGCNLYLNNEGELYFAVSASSDKTMVNISNGQLIEQKKQLRHAIIKSVVIGNF